MHPVAIRPEIVDRVMKRRGRLHWFDALDPRATALVVVDMQPTFCEPGAPAEVPMARAICGAINRLAAAVRARGGTVVWVLHANTHRAGRSDWDLFYDNVVTDEVRVRTIESLSPGRQPVWQDLIVGNDDFTIVKNRYSALIQGASNLERLLRSLKLDTLLITGTKTNVCCEATARDAMMLDFKTVMISDGCAAVSDEEHRATLETFIQNFGDVMTVDEAIERLDRGV